MKIPLHILQDDMSVEACQKRIALHADMAALNPKGWRTPRTKRAGARPPIKSFFDNMVHLVRIVKGLLPKVAVVPDPAAPEPDPVATAINSLTNWQRHQWVKAGRPGRHNNAARILQFAQLVHP